MRLMSKLTLRHIKQNPKRTFFTIVAIALSVVMITAVSFFVASAQDAFQSLIKRSGGNWHAAIFGATGQQVHLILNDPLVESGYAMEDNDIIAVYFRLLHPGKGLEQCGEIARKYGLADRNISFNIDLLAAEGHMIGTFMLVLYAIGAFLGLIIMAGSIIVIANAFAISTGERMRQFGILKSTGATSQQLRASVLVEGGILSAIGIPLGLLVGLLVEVVGISIANALTSGMENTNVIALEFRVVMPFAAIVISVVLSFITVLLSAWFPARKASRVSAIDAIRQADEVKLKPQSVKVARFTQRLFGFEGMLAAKALKRSRRKYRATVISLVVSIVFVLISASFGEMLFSSIQTIYPDIGATALVTRENIATEEARWYTEKISAYPDSNIRMIGLVELEMEVTGNPYTEKAKAYLGTEAPQGANLICLDETAYAEVCAEAGVPLGSSVLLNYTIARYDGRRIELAPFVFSQAAHRIRKPDESTFTLDVSGQITALSAILKEYYEPNRFNVVVPITVFEDAGVAMRAIWLANSPDAERFLAYAEEKLKDASGQYETSNVQAESAMIGNFYLLMMIFIYGFTGLLSLIGITSVISTISTNIRLRMQEFAMLQSVGMTQAGLRKMLNLESLLYALKSLMIGLPLGMGLSYGLHYLFGMLISFAFSVPWIAIFICVLAVTAVTFASMRYAVRQLAIGSIVETMRMVNI